MKTGWSISEVYKLFCLDNKIKSRQTLFNAEERGDIPTAERVTHGHTQVRQWRLDQLPAIGARYGFLSAPEKQKVVSFYTAVSGVLNTSIALNFSRMLALNNIKVLVIGLDVHCSISNLLTHSPEPTLLNEIAESRPGLFEVLFEGKSVNEVIQHTELPTLDFIPETIGLNFVEQKLRFESYHEHVFIDKLMPQLSGYDVVIFDNGPSWNDLVESSLMVADNVISAISCDPISFQGMKTHIKMIQDYKQSSQHSWENFIMIPTLFEQTPISQQIHASYLHEYPDFIAPVSIRKFESPESGAEGISAIEYNAKSLLSQDYYQLVNSLWESISTKHEELEAAHH